MGRLRVLVLDDGTVDSLFDPGSAFSLGDVEVVGTLRIAPCSAAIATMPGADASGGDFSGRSMLRETVAASATAPTTARSGGGDGAPPGQAGPPERDAAVYLTRTELDVLRLLAKGLRNKDIAQELYISVNTVKTHVASIFRKLRVKNRSQAVRYVYSRGVR